MKKPPKKKKTTMKGYKKRVFSKIIKKNTIYLNKKIETKQYFKK